MERRTVKICPRAGKTFHARPRRRRAFLKSALALAAGLAVLSLSCPGNQSGVHARQPVRFGIVTDTHYADIEPSGTRFYRESLDKLDECVTLMNSQRVDFLVELGDLKDQDRSPVEQRTLAYLDKIEEAFQRFGGPTYHVLGNHDLDSLSKAQFLSRVRNTGIGSKQGYYSFDVKGVHFVTLDANYRSDGADYDHGNFTSSDTYIPPQEMEWLKQDLAASGGPAIIFVHQPLDGAVKNAADVRAILEASGKVLAVFQGHLHRDAYSQIAGIHYYTLPAVLGGQGAESSAYAIVEVRADDSLTVTGYHKAATRELARAGSLHASRR